MRRRDVLAGAAQAATGGRAWAQAQAQAARRIGLLSIGTDPDPLKPNPVWLAFLKALDELGWTENRNLVVDRRFAGGNADRLAGLVAELARAQPQIVVATGEPECRAVAAAMPATPLVMMLVPDPVGAGLVASLARPGGQITGLSTLAPETYAKRLQLLKDIVPGLGSVGLLYNPSLAYAPLVVEHSERAAASLAIVLRRLEVRSPQDIAPVFEAFDREKPSALLVVTDGVTYNQRDRLARLASAARLPAMYENRLFVDAGGLLSYGPSYAGLARQAASYAHRILNGARPGDLPIEQPTRFELVVSRGAAKTLGLAFSREFLSAADDVID